MAIRESAYISLYVMVHLIVGVVSALDASGSEYESSGSGSGSGFGEDEIIIPSRYQQSYPLYGLACFPDGIQLDCDCDNTECPCCHDMITKACYRPTFYRWSDWHPCLACNDLCDETQECRIRYDDVTPSSHDYYPESMLLGRRRKRDTSYSDEYLMHPFLEWLKGPGMHRCQVQRTECRPRQYGEWADWIPSGICSEICSIGLMTRSRVCLNVADGSLLPDEDCGDGDAQDTVPCNAHLCEVIGEWTGVGDCFIEFGACVQNATRVCDVGPELEENCTESVIPCTSEEGCKFGRWSSWSGVGECSETCSNGTQQYTRVCQDDDGNVLGFDDCVGGVEASSKIDVCNSDLCETYSDWSSTMPCSVACGNGSILETRTCDVLGTDPEYTPPAECVEQNVTCIEDPCVELGDWGDYGPCDSTCTPGLSTRTRPCYVLGTTIETTGCNPDDLVEAQVCNDVLCTDYSAYQTTPGSVCLGSPDSCQQPQIESSRTCTASGAAPPECLTSLEDCSEPAEVLDILFLVDVSRDIDRVNSTAECLSVSGNLLYGNPVLNDSERLPNFVQMKQFLSDFVCTFNNISMDNTRIALATYPGTVAACATSVDKNFNDFDAFTAIEQLPLVCEPPSVINSMFCIDSLISAASGERTSAPDIVIYIISSMSTTLFTNLGTFNGLFSHYKTTPHLRNRTFAVVYADNEADLTSSELDDIRELACLQLGVLGCPNYLGSTRDDVATMIQTLLNLPVAYT